jgi:ectoine hydroxylase-related dioxygenase (phytanoyl-CoA dioxygenase family)
MEVVTLWLAVDDSTPENGCMRVIPRTQHLDLKKMKERTDVANVLASGLDENEVEADNAVDVILKAGDVSVHHPNLIHGSRANHSPKRRAGLTIRYIPTTTRIKAEQFPSAFLLRGKAVPGVNQYLARPKWVAGEHMPFRGCERWVGDAVPA